MDTEGTCFACDADTYVNVAFGEERYEKSCPDTRHVEGRYCVLNRKK